MHAFCRNAIHFELLLYSDFLFSNVHGGGNTTIPTCAVDGAGTALNAVDREIRLSTEQYGCRQGQYLLSGACRAAKTKVETV